MQIVHPQFAVGDPDTGKVSLWVKRTRPTDVIGWTRGEVINGLWNGKFDGEQMIIQKTGRTVPAKIVWQGEAPFGRDHYNEAIAWIEQQVKGQS